MKTHTSNFKNRIKLMGRELSSKIIYTLNNEEIELTSEDLNSITPHYESSILKSTMKQLDIDSNVLIPEGTVINYQFGLKIEDSYEYLNYGNYIVYKVEEQKDTNSYTITCYDKMLYSMIPYESMNITYPISIRDYLEAICDKLNLDFANSEDTFANYDKMIQNELYLDSDGNSLDYTFRDVLDELAQVTASTICIDEETDKLEIRYINDTEDTIDEEYLKDVNVEFSKKYGPINSIVLSRSAGTDNVYLSDEDSIEENGLCEIKIKDNQIMNFNDRADYLIDILDKLDGLEYYLNDFSSTGIFYYDLCDRYGVSIGNDIYSCVMFNDEANITQGAEENIYTEMPEETETDYTKADKTDRRINQTYLIVDKQNQVIESFISKIPIITTENGAVGSISLSNLANTKLINLKIHPTNKDILGLFVSPLLKVANGLKALSRGVTFDGEQDVYYKLPDNLYFYNNEIYDEFIYDGSEERIYVIRRVEVDEFGNKSILETPIEEEYEYEDIIVEEGDYNVFMSSYPSAYIYVKAMIKNEYTDTFATKLELNTSITQTAEEINLEVSKKVDETEIISKINQSAEQISINASKVNLTGYITATDLSGTGTTVINGSNITTGTIDGNEVNVVNVVASSVAAENITGTTISGKTINGGNINMTSDNDNPKVLITGYSYGGANAVNQVVADGMIINTDNTNVLRLRAVRTTSGSSVGYSGDIHVASSLTNDFAHIYNDGFATGKGSSPSAYMYSDGEVHATTYTGGSLESIKKNIEKYDNALKTILGADLYSYNLKTENDKDKKHIGLIISNSKKKYNTPDDVISKKGDGVDLYSMISMSWQAIKEQQKIIEDLQSRIEKLEGGK